MGASALPLILFSLIWGGVGIVAPYFVPAGPHKQLFQLCLSLTGACCWLLWLCCYMAQMNPLIGKDCSALEVPPGYFAGPELDQKSIVAMHYYWGELN